MGAETFRDSVCNNCLGPIIEGGVGVTKEIIRAVPTSMTFMVDGEGSASPQFSGSDVRFRYGPWGLLRSSLLPNLQLMASGSYRRPLFSREASHIVSTAQIRWGILRNVALDLKVERFWKPDIWEEAVRFLIYF